MLHYIVFAIFVILLLRKFEDTAILVSALACWLSIFRDPLNSVGNMYLTLSLIIIIVGLIKYNKQVLRAPFFYCIIPILITYSITMDAHGIYPKQYLMIVSQYLFPCILYCILNDRKQIYLFVKYATIFLFIAVSYCFFEESISANPIMRWCETHTDSFTWLIDRTEFRFGVKRAQSFFADVVPFGMSCAYAFIVFFTLMGDKETIMQSKFRRILMFSLPVGVFLTGTRSVIMCFLIACISLLTPQTIRRYRFPMIVIALIVGLFMGSYFSSIYDSIFVDSTELGGSSSDMREGQWEIAFFYMVQDFWVGNGINFTGNLLNSGGVAGLFGAEGMWLPVMMDRGMIGVICTLVAFIIGLIYILKRGQYKFVWIWISFLLMKTITTGVGVEPTYYEVILVILFRYSEFNKLFVTKRKEEHKFYDFNNYPHIQGVSIS